MRIHGEWQTRNDSLTICEWYCLNGKGNDQRWIHLLHQVATGTPSQVHFLRRAIFIAIFRGVGILGTKVCLWSQFS